MKTKVNGGEAFLVMLAVTTVLLTILPLPSYFLSTYSADATTGGRGDDSQTSEDLGKEDTTGGRGDDSQTSEDLGKEEQDDKPQVAGQDAPDNEEEEDSGVLGAEFRGGQTIKEGSGTAGGEESGGDPSSEAELLAELRGGETTKQAPIAISGDNVYIVWWTNKTTTNNTNDEVMFRASNDSGTTFGDKINLSNTTDSDSTRVEIDSDANSVVVTWWERNQTSDTPVMRVSNDNGATFGPVLTLAANDTIGGGG